MRKSKYSICLLLSAALCVGMFYGCSHGGATSSDGDSGGGETSGQQALVGKYSTVWTQPSTTKIMRTEAVPENAVCDLKISAAGGEAESAQIIITPHEVEIESYSVAASELSCGDQILPASCVEIYVQQYIETTTKTNRLYPTGWYPDALVPYEYAKRAGELHFNPDSGTDNQGIWVTVNVPRGQAAGIYEGKLELTVEEEHFSVPFSVNVYAFDLPEATHAKTAFAIWENTQMIESGYDNGSPMTAERKDAIVKAEYEYLVSKRISPTNIPSSEYASGNPDSFAAAAKKYASRPEISAYRIAIDAPNRVLNETLFTSYLRSLLKAGIENGEVKTDLFAKAYCYFFEIDEPHPSTGGADIYDKVKAVNDTFMRSKETILGEMDSSYANVKGIETLKASLKALPHVVTSERKTELLGKVQTFCPQVQFYNDRAYYDETELRKEQNGEGAWWYTCLKPVAPYPSYHIDDTQIGARVMGWMQRDYKIDGNLYWCTNVYRKYSASSGYGDRDIWNDPMAFPGANGDGFLTYPGVRYGIDAPLGTIRLDAVRDAQEDYEYLWLLERLVSEANEKYGTEIAGEALLRDLYDSLYSGSIAVTDPYAVLNAREEVARMIEALESSSQAIIEVQPYSAGDGMFSVRVAASASASVKINGEAAVRQGKLFVGQSDASEILVEIDGKTYTRNMGGAYRSVTGLEEDVSCETGDWTAERTGEKHYEGLNSLRLDLSPVTGGGLTYVSDFDLQFSAVDVSGSKKVVAYLYNDTDAVLQPTVALVDARGKSSRNETVAYLYPGKWNKVEISVTATKSMDLTQVNVLRISQQPPAAGKIRLYLDNVFYFG